MRLTAVPVASTGEAQRERKPRLSQRAAATRDLSASRPLSPAPSARPAAAGAERAERRPRAASQQPRAAYGKAQSRAQEMDPASRPALPPTACRLLAAASVGCGRLLEER